MQTRLTCQLRITLDLGDAAQIQAQAQWRHETQLLLLLLGLLQLLLLLLLLLALLQQLLQLQLMETRIVGIEIQLRNDATQIVIVRCNCRFHCGLQIDYGGL